MSFQLLLLLTVVALCYVAVVGYATADVKGEPSYTTTTGSTATTTATTISAPPAPP